MRLVSTVFLMLFAVQLVAAQEPKPAQSPEEAAMMQAWMQFATPGEPHKKMQQMVGVWDSTIKMYMDPGAPTESKGTSTYTSLMDGRYVQEVAEGVFNGMPFHGLGIYGYDNLKKKYVSLWIDNMGTGLMVGTGESPDQGKTVNWTATSSDPMLGKESTYHSVVKEITADQFTFEMSGPGPDGKEMKMMEMTYTRRK
ncbi:MAG: DUF1579 domain-containing protein [Acidobacteriota bacterium]